MHKNILVEVENLSKNFSKKRPVLEQLSFLLYENECVALVGKNGQGKSTLMKLLLGILHPTNGKIDWKSNVVRERICYLPEKTFFHESITAGKYLRQVQLLTDVQSSGKQTKEEGSQKDNIFASLSEQVLSYQNRPMNEYSKGMLQKTFIYGGLISHAHYFILDEPFSGLDEESRRDLVRILDYLKRSGKSILFTSHHLVDAYLLADRIFVLKNGKIDVCENSKFLEDPSWLATKKETLFSTVNFNAEVENHLKDIISLQRKGSIEEKL